MMEQPYLPILFVMGILQPEVDHSVQLQAEPLAVLLKLLLTHCAFRQ